MISYYYLFLISLFNVNNYYATKETIKSTKKFSNYEYKIKYENFFCGLNKPFLIVPNLLNYKLEYLRIINFKFWDKFNLKNTKLNLDYKKIKIIPTEIQLLTNLKHLYLNNNQIKEVLKEIQFLTNLQYVHLFRNKNNTKRNTVFK